jgi:hypothetical protein
MIKITHSKSLITASNLITPLSPPEEKVISASLKADLIFSGYIKSRGPVKAIIRPI